MLQWRPSVSRLGNIVADLAYINITDKIDFRLHSFKCIKLGSLSEMK